jgi:predicted nucleic acid-binding protein
MTIYVVDSSVAIKWYVPEIHKAAADRVLASGAALHAPDFLDVEMAAILWKKLRRGELTRLDADDILSDLAGITALARHMSSPLVVRAFDLANQTGRTVYDSLYLSLAVQLSGQLVTADDRLANAIATTPWAAHILKLQDVP